MAEPSEHAPQVDVRSPRFGAGVTTVVLAVVLVLGAGTAGAVLLAVQAVVFALGAAGRPPYGWFFARFVRPRLGPVTETEDARPVRFAQTVGLVFALVGLVGALTGASVLFAVAVAAALVAAFLNAAFAFCLGCEMYLLLKRATA
ncbi:MAG: DUF4395 domain-containing protein [Actinomycetes bacterium]